MKNKIGKSMMALFSILLLTSCSDNSSDSDITRGTQTVISEKYFFSNFIGDSIKLDISVPPDYASNPGRKYRVIYLTDGYWRRGEHDTIHKMGEANVIEKLIVVGIGYPDSYNFDEIRKRDLLTNADKLLTSIREEIIPYIEDNYRADPNNRTLWGSSYGGYFLVYAFIQHENMGRLFKNYISASPALNPPNPCTDLLRNEEDLYTKTKILPLNLYITVGGNESPYFINSYDEITKRISSRNYDGLNFDYEVIPGTDHYTVWKPTLLNGLKKFLKPLQ